MKIGSKPDTPLVSSDIAARANVRSSTTSAIPAVAGIAAIDQATVSAAGTAISQQAGSADFDSAKVDSIRQAIREGRFSVNPEAIADRLIADAAALLSPRSV
ncbi:flagellar biosynthesis anti-sigma factor FlgM [uncultured Ramlibacter sp.]|uniref:flagellar biosynthesis anti-sigma factor FlgM n=1 Tax=uncultured Ramlibacter sp. TaxID=260755 RepID=UPI00260E2CA2|nr:flagellar biosynthesis anti-sigma factor FlgM [uncultured Ramlibacter sp.]